MQLLQAMSAMIKTGQWKDIGGGGRISPVLSILVLLKYVGLNAIIQSLVIKLLALTRLLAFLDSALQNTNRGVKGLL